MPSLPPAGTATSPVPTPKPKPAPTPAPKPAAPTSMNPTQWAQLVAQDLGINVNQDPNAVLDILSWMPNEEPTSSWWGGYGTAAAPTRINPLNAGDIGNFGYSGQASGLGGYANLTNAAGATAQMIGQQNMSPILAALRAGDAPGAFSKALETSPWAGSHYGGATFTAAQAESEAQGAAVTNKAAIGSGGNVSASSAVAGALSSQTNPAIVAQQNADEAIQQSLQLTPQELADQQAILKANYGYSQQQFGIQGQQLGLSQNELNQQYNQTVQQRQYQMQQDILTGQGITDSIANIMKQYGFQQQALQQATQQGLQGEAASGVYNTGTRRQFLAGQALTASQQAASEQYSLQQARLSQQQLGVTEAQQKAQYGYSQEQIQNGAKNLRLQQQALGISEAQAKTQYNNALQQLDLNSIMGADQLEEQIATLAGGGYSPLGGMISQLQSLIPGLAGAMGNSGSSLSASGGNTTGG